MTGETKSRAPSVSTKRMNKLHDRFWSGLDCKWGSSHSNSLDSAMTRNVNGRIGERSEEFLEVEDQAVSTSCCLLEGLDERRNNLLEGLIDDSQAVRVVALDDVRAHEGEDWHDVLHELIGDQRTQLREQEERLVVGLRVDRRCDKGDKFVIVPKLRVAEDIQRMKSRTGVMRIDSLVTPEVGATFSTTLPSAPRRSWPGY